MICAAVAVCLCLTVLSHCSFDPGIPNSFIGKETHFDGNGFQDFTDYCKYYYRDSFPFTDNPKYRYTTAEDLDELYSLAYHAYVDNAPYAYFPLPSSVTDTETNRELSADIWTPLNDEANNYIMGLSDWESFENLLNELKDYGMDQITEEVNAAYQALK